MDTIEAMTLQEKVRFYFEGIAVNKNSMMHVFKDYNLPSFIRDWFLKKYGDKNGEINTNYLQSKINDILPSQDHWNGIMEALINQHKKVKILAKINLVPKLKSGTMAFELPTYGLSSNETYVLSSVLEDHRKELLSGAKDIWGVLTLGVMNFGEKKIDYKITLESFVSFRPYDIDLSYFRSAREHFSLNEWIDVLLEAIDYNASGFTKETEKVMILTRLLPFVEKRVNLIELAPKGTGKSYVYSQISKYGWLNSGGVMTRAKLLYDMSKRQEGLIPNYDFVALDEIRTIKFPDAHEMQASLKGYLENGRYTVGVKEGKADAGVILLGNIPQEKMHLDTNFIGMLSNIFSDSAVLDRFHGFIEGWNISRMSEDKKVNGWAINSEYLAEVFHTLRDDIAYRSLVDNHLLIPAGSDTRDVEAIKRLTTAYVKLLFPHWKTTDLFDSSLFERYCLKPAIRMRSIIKTQLGFIDIEYRNKAVPDITIR